MVTQIPPQSDFATKDDLENLARIIVSGVADALEQSEQRSRSEFMAALESSERRIRSDLTEAVEQSKQRVRDDSKQNTKVSEYRLLLEKEKAKVAATLRWMVGGLIGLSSVMMGCVLGAIFGLAP